MKKLYYINSMKQSTCKKCLGTGKMLNSNNVFTPCDCKENEKKYSSLQHALKIYEGKI